VVQKPVGGGAADLPVATAVISEAVHSGSAAVSEDAPRRVMPSAAVSGTLGRGILAVARSSVSGTLGRGISAVVISFSSTSRDYNFLSINSRDASRFTLLRQMGDALLQGSSQIMRWETRHWKARLRSSDGRRAFGRNVSDHEDGRRATARLVSDHEMGDELLDGSSQIMRMGDAQLQGSSQIMGVLHLFPPQTRPAWGSGDASLEGSSQIIRWETRLWTERLRS
jgi:hypothetical protein